MEFIKKPEVGDFYLVNRKKLEKTQFAQDEKYIKRHGGYQIFQIAKVTEKDIILNINGSSYIPYSYAVENLNKGVAYDQDYYKAGKQVTITRSELTKLNIFNTIKSIHRLNDSVDIRSYKVAYSMCKKREYEKSTKYIDSLIYSSLNLESYEELGDCLYDAKQYDKALKLYIRSSEINPSKAQPAHMAGLCYVMLGDYPNAITYNEKAIQADPKHKPTYGNLGSVYSKINDSKNALKYYKIAFEKGEHSQSFIANYIEASLIEGEEFNSDLEELSEKNDYFHDKSYRMKFEMLKILFMSRNISDVSQLISEWESLFSGTKLDWNFDQLEYWAKSEKQKNMIKFFKTKTI